MSEPARTNEPTDAARFLMQAAAWLMVIGLASGGLIAAAMQHQVTADVHATVAAHLNALIGSLWMVAVALTMPMLRYGPVGQLRLAWGLILANYANWLVTTVKAFLRVAGVGPGESAANTGVFVTLTSLVVVPALGSALAWALGFRKR